MNSVDSIEASSTYNLDDDPYVRPRVTFGNTVRVVLVYSKEELQPVFADLWYSRLEIWQLKQEAYSETVDTGVDVSPEAAPSAGGFTTLTDSVHGDQKVALLKAKKRGGSFGNYQRSASQHAEICSESSSKHIQGARRKWWRKTRAFLSV